MRRKGRKRLLDALLVTDIGKHRIENTDFGALGARDMKPRLRHQRHKPESLKRNRLASGVGTCDYHGVIAPAELDRDRNHLFLIDKRVSCPAEEQIFSVVHHRLDSIGAAGKLTLREYERKLGYVVIIGGYPPAVRSTFS